MRQLYVIFLAAMLASCASLSGQVPESDSTPAAVPKMEEQEEPEVYTPVSGELLYKLLLGELAGHQGSLDVSVVQYIDAAYETTDPRVAQRATQIAIYAKDWPRGLQAAERWVEVSPDNVKARQAHAAMLMMAKQDAEATKALMTLIELSEAQSLDLYDQLRPVLLNTEVVGGALKITNTLVETQADSADVWLLRAQVTWHAGMYQEAVSAADRALALRPHWPPAVLLLVQGLRDQRMNARALAVVEDALKVHPNHFRLRLQRARLLVANEREKEASVIFKQLVEERPDDGEVLYAAGLMALREQNQTVAEGYFKQLLVNEDYAGRAAYYLGRLAEEREDFDAAKQWYQHIDDQEIATDAMIRLIGVYARQDQWNAISELLEDYRFLNPDQRIQSYLIEVEVVKRFKGVAAAREVAAKALQNEPDNVELLYTRGMLAVEMGDLLVLEKDMRRIIELDPDNASALNALGYSLADMTDRYQEAYQLIAKAYSLKSDDPAVIDSLGWVLYKLGKTSEAVKYLQQAHELSAEPEIAVHLGEVLWVMGDKQMAKLVWKKVKDQQPDSELLQQTMERLGAH